jgi:hypothetical protein
MIAAMRHLGLAAVTVAFFLAAVGSLRPVAADEVKAIETGSKGDLTMCPMRDFSCNLYHRIALPLQLTIGEKVSVSFGSNPKQYDFPVARIIVRDGGGCTVFSYPLPPVL